MREEYEETMKRVQLGARFWVLSTNRSVASVNMKNREIRSVEKS